MYNVQALVERAKDGAITPSEVDWAVDQLAEEHHEERYQLVYIVGRAGARTHEPVLAAHLEWDEDPAVAALALSTLTVQWGLSERYRGHILSALRGIDWDDLEQVKRAAVSAAGEHLRSHADCEVFTELMKVAEAPDDPLLRRFALEALARALGEPYATAIPPRDRAAADLWMADIESRARERLSVDCV